MKPIGLVSVFEKFIRFLGSVELSIILLGRYYACCMYITKQIHAHNVYVIVLTKRVGERDMSPTTKFCMSRHSNN